MDCKVILSPRAKRSLQLRSRKVMHKMILL